jgi:hypothetical protein
MLRSDFLFANDVRAAAELRTPLTLHMLLASSLGLLPSAMIQILPNPIVSDSPSS